LTLEQVVPGGSVVVGKVGGARSFRRRLMELGIIPGTRVEVLRVAPFGDPMELSARGCNLSIRATEAAQVEVEWVSEAAAAPAASPIVVASLAPAKLVAAASLATSAMAAKPASDVAGCGCGATESRSTLPVGLRLRPAAAGASKSLAPKSVVPEAVVELAKSLT
jgi:ferrous iron transport protein A